MPAAKRPFAMVEKGRAAIVGKGRQLMVADLP
jgi:hypothetical protein